MRDLAHSKWQTYQNWPQYVQEQTAQIDQSRKHHNKAGRKGRWMHDAG